MISYPLAIVNVFVAGALIHLYLHKAAWQWNPPIKATLPVAVFFLLSNIYLTVAPFVPPTDGNSVYETLPYYLHCLVGIAIIVAGGIYWVIWAVLLPRIGHYRLEREVVVDEIDGWERHVFKKLPN